MNSPRRNGRWIRIWFGLLFGFSLLSFSGRLHYALDVFSHWQVYYAGGYAVFLGFMFAWKRFSAAFWLPWRIRLLAFVGLIMHAGQVLWLFIPLSSQDLDLPNPLRLVWANVQSANPKRSHLFQFIREAKADICAFSEVPEPLYVDLLAFTNDYPYQQWHEPSNLLVLSRHPLLRQETVSVSANRRVLRSRVKIGRRQWSLWVLHNDKPSTPGNIKTFQELGQTLSEETNALIVGDFNTSCWSAIFRSFCKQADLRQARRGFGILNSWLWPTLDWIRIPIDHVLLKGKVNVKDLRLGPDLRSDHLPLIVDLELGGPRSHSPHR